MSPEENNSLHAIVGVMKYAASLTKVNFIIFEYSIQLVAILCCLKLI
jgi:hypothetical protein